MSVSNTCKKKAYRDLKDAHSALNCIKRESDRFQIPARAYFCEDCGNYHLTKYDKEYYKNKIWVSGKDLAGEVTKQLKHLIAKQHEKKQSDNTGRPTTAV